MNLGLGLGAKDLLIALPILGTALAVTYDVGYFWGLDINYFSAFSVTEHVTFALEYLPFALALSSVAFILPFFIQWAWTAGRESARREVKSGKNIPFYRNVFNWLLFAAILYDAFWWWYSRHLLSLIALIFLVAVVVMTSFRATFAHIVAFLFLCVISAFAVAFALGFDSANAYRKSEKYHYVVTPIQGAPIKPKIVRAGDKGWLFYEESSKALVLLPWGQIKEISSTP